MALLLAKTRAVTLFEEQPARGEAFCACLRTAFRSMESALHIIANSSDGQGLEKLKR